MQHLLVNVAISFWTWNIGTNLQLLWSWLYLRLTQGLETWALQSSNPQMWLSLLLSWEHCSHAVIFLWHTVWKIIVVALHGLIRRGSKWVMYVKPLCLVHDRYFVYVSYYDLQCQSKQKWIWMGESSWLRKVQWACTKHWSLSEMKVYVHSSTCHFLLFKKEIIHSLSLFERSSICVFTSQIPAGAGPSWSWELGIQFRSPMLLGETTTWAITIAC